MGRGRVGVTFFKVPCDLVLFKMFVNVLFRLLYEIYTYCTDVLLWNNDRTAILVI